MKGNQIKQVLVVLLCGLLLGFAIPPLAVQPDKPPLAHDGPYQVSVRIMHLTDASRNNRRVGYLVRPQ